MGKVDRWWCAAALCAAIGCASIGGCKSSGDPSGDGPPPEEYYGDEGGDAMVDEGAGYADGADEAADGAMDGATDAAAAAAPADPNAISVNIAWEGEGDAKKAAIKVTGGGQEKAFESASEELTTELTTALKAMKASVADGGGEAVVSISAPADIDFDATVKPIMLSCFRAGFGTQAVKYEPRMP